MVECNECGKKVDIEKEIFAVCPYCGEVTCEGCMKKANKDNNLEIDKVF